MTEPSSSARGSEGQAAYDAHSTNGKAGRDGSYEKHWTAVLATTARDSLPQREAKGLDSPYTMRLEASVWAHGYNDCRKALRDDLGTLVALVERLAAGRWDHLPTKDVEAFIRLREVARA